ncbi:MAG: cyclodeaminase/cyclohydrolase family protein [Endomicrobia bacterium]|nr:cyclodeaminase/cyclohydrolase family protein [Endomicrobiia bacterium]
METYLSSSIEKYLNDLASNLPAPGGGSASALVSTTGISCLLMVANFTVNKRGYEDVQEEIKKIIEELTQIKEKLQNYIDRDVEAYKEVSKAYKLPKETPLEIEKREKQIQISLEHAATIAYEIMELSHKGILYSEKLLKIGNKNLITDVLCGTLFLFGAIQAAKYNLVINIKNSKNVEFIEEKRKQAKKILTDAKIITKKLLQKTKI